MTVQGLYILYLAAEKMVVYDRKMECKTPLYTVSPVLPDHQSWINNHS